MEKFLLLFVFEEDDGSFFMWKKISFLYFFFEVCGVNNIFSIFLKQFFFLPGFPIYPVHFSSKNYLVVWSCDKMYVWNPHITPTKNKPYKQGRNTNIMLNGYIFSLSPKSAGSSSEPTITIMHIIMTVIMRTNNENKKM